MLDYDLVVYSLTFSEICTQLSPHQCPKLAIHSTYINYVRYYTSQLTLKCRRQIVCLSVLVSRSSNENGTGNLPLSHLLCCVSCC